ncbi:MAG: CHAT domain-containing protein [Actinobacteria bacterium]|nr:CHAT domain-containing protein [Actinomycetota bacterium]
MPNPDEPAPFLSDLHKARVYQRDEGRRRKEKTHARELAHLAQPTVRYIHEIRQVPTPQPEILRVAYLTANPHVTDTDPVTDELVETRIRVDKEIRDVREEVKRAPLRDYIEIEHWPAAQPTDVLNALNDQAPHVLHFSGHGGAQELEFDDGAMDDPEELPVSFVQLAQALGATSKPPLVLVLNACDTLDGAEALLAAVPVVIATARSITDLAANVFAARFYSAIAAGQSVQHAVDQACYAIDVLAGGEGDIIWTLTREDVDLETFALIRAPEVGP